MTHITIQRDAYTSNRIIGDLLDRFCFVFSSIVASRLLLKGDEMVIEQILRIGQIITADEIERANRDYDSARREEKRSKCRRTGKGVSVVPKSEEN